MTTKTLARIWPTEQLLLDASNDVTNHYLSAELRMASQAIRDLVDLLRDVACDERGIWRDGLQHRAADAANALEHGMNPAALGSPSQRERTLPASAR